jgi:hypothetical protein
MARINMHSCPSPGQLIIDLQRRGRGTLAPFASGVEGSSCSSRPKKKAEGKRAQPAGRPPPSPIAAPVRWPRPHSIGRRIPSARAETWSEHARFPQAGKVAVGSDGYGPGHRPAGTAFPPVHIEGYRLPAGSWLAAGLGARMSACVVCSFGVDSHARKPLS